MIISDIIQQVILPIILLIGTGIILHRSFEFEMNTLSKLLFYFYIPALTFVKIYEAKTSPDMLLIMFGFLIVQFVSMYVISMLANKACGHNKRIGAAFSNSVVLTNNGNVGIPVNDLVFHHNPLAMSVQMVVVLFEILAVFTYGIIHTSTAQVGLKKTLWQLGKMPVFYCLLLGVAFNLFKLKVPDFIWIPMNTAAGGMLGLALVSVGAQIASVRMFHNTFRVMLSSGIRLIVSPCVAFGLITLFSLEGILAQTLWIASAMPTSRNSAALALEYNNEPEYAAQTVLMSTLFCSITLTLVVYLAPMLFP
jgi:predicted permease